MADFLITRADQLSNLIAVYGAFWFYLFLFFSNVMENVFPPYPGDTVILIGGYLASAGKLSFLGIFFTSLLGCLVGAMILYFLGQKKGRGVFKQGKIFNLSNLAKIEGWFKRYGEEVILGSRFLTGIRSGVALCAGLGNVKLKKMIFYSSFSIALWNGLLIFLAASLHKNWQVLYKFFVVYNRVVLILVIIVSAAVIFVWIKRRLKNSQNVSLKEKS